MKKNGYVTVVVKEVEKPLCRLCQFEGKRRIATHEVAVTHWHKWLGGVARTQACKRHIEEIKTEFLRQTKGGAS